ncbi:hypothetical protein [Staphylococcus petrasii]
MVNQSFLLARMRLIGLNTPLRVVTHWCGNSMYELVSEADEKII